MAHLIHHAQIDKRKVKPVSGQSACSVLGHFLMIKAYEVAEAGTIQPFAYFQLVFVSIMGFALFGERPDRWTIAGGALILAAGLYTLVRQARLSRSRR